MAAPTVRTSVVRRWICFVAAVGFLAAGCATGSGAESGDEKVAEEAPPRPGTDRWSGAALHLPEGAPIAVEMRPDDLLASAQGLRRWIAAEPQMFGERGDQIVAQMRAFWGMMEQRMGTDPFSPRAARKLGIDASRPVYVGLYPASAGGSGQFVTAVERTLRERLEVGEDGDLLEALLAVERGERSAPRGLHRDVLNAVESLQPWTGMRVLVPTKEAPELVGRIATLARFGGYRAVDSNGEGDASAPRVWVNPKSQWEAFSVRRVGSDSEERGWIRVDVLFRQWEPRASLAESVDEQVAAARRALQSLSETVPSGRPDAPRPVGKPALAATMDQKATSAYARLQGYRRVLAETRRAAADERDEKLISGLADAVRLGRNWELASDRLTGLSYTFSASADERALFELTMRLFGPAREQLPAPRGAPIGVGVSDRSFGLSLGLAPMFSDEWRGWLDIEQPDRVVEQLRASDFDPTLYGLAFPRTLALLSINVDRIVSDTLPGSFEPLFGHRDRLRRFELATSGLGSDSFGGDPQFVALLALEPDTPSDEQRDVFRALPTGVRVLARAAEDAPMLDALGGEADAGEKGADQAPPSDRWVVLRGGEGEGPAVRYYAHPSAENPFAFVTYGLSEQRARDELDRARTGDRRARGDSVFYARVEPPTLLSVLGAFESKSLAPLDPGVLAQRIGPLVATIRPVATPDAQTIVYTFELQPPPEL